MQTQIIAEQFDFLDRLKDGLQSNAERFSFRTAPTILATRFKIDIVEAIRIVSGWAQTYEPELSATDRAKIFIHLNDARAA